MAFRCDSGGVYALNPAMPVLLRPDGTVQIGWDPRRAVAVRPPGGLSRSGLAAVLKAMPLSPNELHKLARKHGLLDPAALDEVVDGLAGRGVLQPCVTSSGRSLSVRIHGGGPLATVLAEGLRNSGVRMSLTRHHAAAGATTGVDLVVLTDTLGIEPRLLRDLHAAKVPHLPVRVRDGAGMVGPLVIPGVTSCLSCADLHRTDRDAAWPVLANQLRGLIGCADRPTLLATAALALEQLQRIIAGVRGNADALPSTWNTTWEVHVGSHTILARRWPRHPLCPCWNSRLPLSQGQG